MAENSKIEWTTHTFNPWRGCTKVSEGCKHCYAETLSKRNPKTLGIWGDNGTRVVASESYWKQPLKWNRDAAQRSCGFCEFDEAEGTLIQQCETCSQRPRVFCASLADVFEDRPELIEPRRRLFHTINETPNLDWLLLTKRPESVGRLFDDVVRHFGWDENLSAMNVWLGTTVENQEQADKRIPELLNTPAIVRFLSCEPLLGEIDLRAITALDGDGPDSNLYWIGQDASIDWVIAGGESGPGARPVDIRWFRSLRDQCVAAGVPFHFKQWGGVNKKANGRSLDGREWNESPNAKTT